MRGLNRLCRLSRSGPPAIRTNGAPADGRRLDARGSPVDSGGMKLTKSENGRTSAIAAYQGPLIVGYGVRARDGWLAVGALGMSWAKWKCSRIADVQAWLRTTSHAGRFDWYSDIKDLRKLFDALPDHQKPGITLDSFGEDALAPLRLTGMPMVYFQKS